MKQLIGGLFTALLVAVTASGCDEKKHSPALSRQEEKPDALVTALTQSDEIYSYVPPQEGKLLLEVGYAGNVGELDALNQAFMARYPNCHIVLKEYYQGMRCQTLCKAILSERKPDVLLISGNIDKVFPSLSAHLVDFSGDPITERYHKSVLQASEIDGRLYYLPGPSDITSLTYNKTLFDRYGWQLPADYGDFLALCQQITADTDGAVEPFNPNGKYASVLVPLFEMITYEQILASLSDQQWLNAFEAGEATFAGHMEPYFEAVEEMAAAGVLREDHFTYSATTRSNEFFSGDIAIINSPRYSSSLSTADMELGYMPFWGQEPGQEYLELLQVYGLFVPKKVQTDEKQAMVDAYVAFLSSGEAQALYMGGSVMVPSVTDIPLEGTHGNENAATLVAAIEKGHLVQAETFQNDGFGKIQVQMRAQMLAIVQGEQDAAGACVAIDRYAADYRSGKIPAPAPQKLGEAAEDFTVLQTTEYFCDKYRAHTGADLSLFMTNVPRRAYSSPIFAGTIDTWDTLSLTPRSFDADDCLQLVEMTGENLLDCLNHPYDGLAEPADCVYAFSGLKATVAPWYPQGERYLSVTLADGSPIAPDDVYTVAIWSGSVNEAYISRVLQHYEGTFADYLTRWLAQDSPLSPARDGRMTLVWDTAP